MKVLITGGAGFIGSNLARYLLDKGQDVVIFDNFSTGKRENIEEIAEKTTLIEGDVREYNPVLAVVRGVDAISRTGRPPLPTHEGRPRIEQGHLRRSFAPHDISVILALAGNQLPEKVVCTGGAYRSRTQPSPRWSSQTGSAPTST